jgi:hypothetical protein
MRRALVLATSAVVLVGGLGQVPGLAGSPAGTVTVIAGTGTLYTSDNCSQDPGSGRWIYSLDLTLAVRAHGRQRAMTISSPWMYPPGWPDYNGGERSVPCDYRTFPVMSFAGKATDASTLVTEPVHGYCWNDRGPLGAVDLNCRLSIHGRSPVLLRMVLTDVYDAYETEHSAGEDDNKTLVVSGVQP